MPRALNVDWSAVQLDYQRGKGNVSPSALAKKYNIPVKAITQRAWRQKWTYEAKETARQVTKQVVEKLVDQRIKQIEEIQGEAVPIARLLQTEVKKTVNDMNGAALEPSELNGLAQALKTANMVALVNSGWVQQSSVDVTSGGLSTHETALSILQSCRKAVEQGFDSSTLDVDSMVKKLENERNKQE